MKNRTLKAAPLLILSLSGCTLFFGTVRPVEVRSADYRILDLTKTDPQWVRLDSQVAANPAAQPKGQTDLGDNEAGVSDMAFQEKKTGSVISVNSACKSYKGASANEDLNALTQELLLGMADQEILDQKWITLAQIPAQETTAKGTMNRENVVLKTVVLEKSNCVYDLVLVAKPRFFKRDDPTFSRFVSSLQFK